MKPRYVAVSLVFALGLSLRHGLSYPPGVGITSKEKNCIGCHVNNGPWKDDARTIIDILDGETKQSLRQSDGSFLIPVRRGETRAVVTVIGRAEGNDGERPYRNAWAYVDPRTVGSRSLSKFAPGWDVSLPMSCRVVGDTMAGFEHATITALPMSIRPTDAAQDAELTLQVMLTRGESVKGKAKEGMIGSYFERTVRLRVTE